jgi:hypothetical protein
MNATSPPLRDRLPDARALEPGPGREGSSDPNVQRLEKAVAAIAEPSPTITTVNMSAVLQRESHERITAVRLLEQSQHALMCAEMDRHVAYDELARNMPIVTETSKQLTTAVDASRPGHPLSNLKELFLANERALEKLEAISATLGSHFLRYQTAWEQYSRSVVNAQKLKGG